MSNTTLLITFAQPNAAETETFQSYVGASTHLAVAAGAEVSTRFPVRHLIGNAPASVFGLATFPSVEAVTALFESDEYRALIPSRAQGLDGVDAYAVDDADVLELPEPDGVYLVVAAAPNPDAAEDLQTYQAGSAPVFAKHGAAPVAQLPVAAHPVGDTPAAFVAIFELPTAEAAEALFDDPAYRAIVPVRDRALASLNVYVTTG